MNSSNRASKRRPVDIPGVVYDLNGAPIVACAVRDVRSAVLRLNSP